MRRSFLKQYFIEQNCSFWKLKIYFTLMFHESLRKQFGWDLMLRYMVKINVNFMKYIERKFSRCILPLATIMQTEKPLKNDLLRQAYIMKFFLNICLNFSFDSFLSTFHTCMQLVNLNEIFQFTIMKVFQKKKFLPDFW